MSHKKQYDAVARSFHGIMAVMMIGLLAAGLYMSDLDPSPQKWQIYGIHKALGITILALVVLRILWRAGNQPPSPLPSQAAWEHRLSKLIHFLLYFGMIAMPVSGYIMSSAGGHDVSIFGLFNLPLIIEKNEQTGEIAKEIHELGGNALIAAIVLHTLGALKHYFIDRDSTVHRMFNFIR